MNPDHDSLAFDRMCIYEAYALQHFDLGGSLRACQSECSSIIADEGNSGSTLYILWPLKGR